MVVVAGGQGGFLKGQTCILWDEQEYQLAEDRWVVLGRGRHVHKNLEAWKGAACELNLKQLSLHRAGVESADPEPR